ncbi:hypothetical protein ACFQBQ_12755 [Granulicella cerasi]|uniref:MBG domain-containing protein n=1 Tax=Granulicella cerasi TaxID=741063 RepID=A0ABW1ZAD4_9BACT|nr:hypothetical protein [Granulicella cerasi]
MAGCATSNSVTSDPGNPGQATSLTLTPSATDFAFGDTASLKATLNTSVTQGSVEFTDKTTNQTVLTSFTGSTTSVPLLGSASTVDLQNLSAPIGAHLYSAKFDQVGNYKASTSGTVRVTIHAPNANCGLGGATVYAGGTVPAAGATITAASTDSSAVCASSSRSLTLTSPVITGTGATLFYNDGGTGAAVLAFSNNDQVLDGGVVTINGGSIVNNQPTGGAVMATGLPSMVVLKNVNTSTTMGTVVVAGGQSVLAGYAIGAARHGIVSLLGGSVTSQPFASAFSVPLFWVASGGQVQASGTTLVANGAVAELEGAASLNLTGVNLDMSHSTGFGVGPTDENGNTGTAQMSLSNSTFVLPATLNFGLFSVNGSAQITLSHNAPLSAQYLLEENILSTSGNYQLSLDGQTVTGGVELEGGNLSMSLANNSQWTGFVNPDRGTAALTLDAGSIWTLTYDCALTTLTDPAITATDVPNIVGNGHTLTYVASKNPALGGKTYTLAGGGTLKSAS